MADRFENDPVADAAKMDELATRAPDIDSAARDPRDVIENAFQTAYEAKWPGANFEQLDACGAVASDRADFYALHGYRLGDPADPSTAALIEIARSANQPTLTLEAIAADPWNAVELPLPADASKELLLAARDAAEHSHGLEHHLMMEARAGRNTEHWSAELYEAGIPQPDVHEYNESRWFKAGTRLGEINEALDKIEGRGVYAEGARPDYAPPITNAERDLYLETLGRYAPDDRVYEVLAAQLELPQANSAYPPVEEALRALLPDNGSMLYPWPQNFGEVVEQIERGWTVRDAVESDMANLPSPDHPGDVARRADYEASTKRQETERAARSGEDVPGQVASSEPDSFAADLRAAEKAAKLEREGVGDERAVIDHDAGNITRGGGGRGMF